MRCLANTHIDENYRRNLVAAGARAGKGLLMPTGAGRQTRASMFASAAWVPWHEAFFPSTARPLRVAQGRRSWADVPGGEASSPPDTRRPRAGAGGGRGPLGRAHPRMLRVGRPQPFSVPESKAAFWNEEKNQNWGWGGASSLTPTRLAEGGLRHGREE